jgi:flavin-dependent dehydrogenase
VIIGGGASGSHAAVWLRDQGKTVAVVEKREVLVSTFTCLFI